MVKVDICARGHNHLVMLLSCFNTTCLTAPAHYKGVWSEATFEDFVPSDNCLSFAVDVFLHALDEIVLKAMLIFQVIVFNSFLAQRADLPVVFWSLITANVYIFVREKRDNFV